MNFRYNDWLSQELSKYNLKFVVADEQFFAEQKPMLPDEIYVVIKYLQADLATNSTTQPVQILFLSENDHLNEVKDVLDQFTETYNWKAMYQNNTFIKQQYNKPIVLNNFNEIDSGYRSILYISGLLLIMENVLDIKASATGDQGYINIDDVALKPLNFAFAYSMTPDTQSFGSIATSVKSVSGISFTVGIPAIDSAMVQKTLNITAESNGYDGNENYKIEFYLGNIHFLFNVKLIAVNFTSSNNAIPGLELGFIR